MKTVKELLDIYKSKDYRFPNHNDSDFVVFADGSWYPFINGHFSNPLNPSILLKAMLGLVPNGSITTMAGPIDMILRTCERATEIRNKKHTYITTYPTGAPKTMFVEGDDVVILGDDAKKKGLKLSILTSQIAGDKYDQSKVPAWNEYGFSHPTILDVTVERDYCDKDNTAQHIYTIKGHCTVNRITIIDREEEDGMRVSYDAYELHPNHDSKLIITSPKYVWQDKEEKDED